jgi:hypothetical protein
MTVGKTHDQLDERLRRWIADQRRFFLATAPSGSGGHVNLSPKGHADTLAILDQRTVAYLDLQRRRDHDPPARQPAHHPHVLRLVRSATDPAPAWAGTDRAGRRAGRDELLARFPARRGARAVVVVGVERIADSCGYAGPRYEYAGERELLEQWTDRRDDAAIAAYRAQRNRTSIDDLPDLPMTPRDRQLVRAEARWVAGRSSTAGPMQPKGARG